MLKPEKQKVSRLRQEMEMEKTKIVDQCKLQSKTVTVNQKEKTLEQGPCEKISEEFCICYMSPVSKWKNGNCPMATHIIHTEDVKAFVNPIKSSKRGGK